MGWPYHADPLAEAEVVPTGDSTTKHLHSVSHHFWSRGVYPEYPGGTIRPGDERGGAVHDHPTGV
jgi:hypothetical protein